jgi:hypothetical protein
MTPAEVHAGSASPTHEPKRLYRLIEPVYDDLPTRDLADFFRLALERTAERFGEECGIEATLLSRREGARWQAVAGSDEGLLERLQRLSRAEHEIFLAEDRLLKAPFPTAIWLLGSRGEWPALLRLNGLPEEGPALLLQMARLAIQHQPSNRLDRHPRPAPGRSDGLLPDPLPTLAGFDLAARRSRPTPSAAMPDAIPPGPGATGLMIADASGHGRPRPGGARRRRLAWEPPATSIDATVERLTHSLRLDAHRGPSRSSTAARSTGWFDYINAGHPALLLTPQSVRARESGRVPGVSRNPCTASGTGGPPAECSCSTPTA